MIRSTFYNKSLSYDRMVRHSLYQIASKVRLQKEISNLSSFHIV